MQVVHVTRASQTVQNTRNIFDLFTAAVLDRIQQKRPGKTKTTREVNYNSTNPHHHLLESKEKRRKDEAACLPVTPAWQSISHAHPHVGVPKICACAAEQLQR